MAHLHGRYIDIWKNCHFKQFWPVFEHVLPKNWTVKNFFFVSNVSTWFRFCEKKSHFNCPIILKVYTWPPKCDLHEKRRFLRHFSKYTSILWKIGTVKVYFFYHKIYMECLLQMKQYFFIGARVLKCDFLDKYSKFQGFWCYSIHFI